MPDQPCEKVAEGDVCHAVAALEASFTKRLLEHELREREFLKFSILELTKEAFPDGVVPHRMAHQAMIDAARTEAAFWQDLRLDMAKKSIWGILKILTMLMVAGLAVKMGLWPAYVAWLTK